MRIGILSPIQGLEDIPYRFAPKRVVRVFVGTNDIEMLAKNLAREKRKIPSQEYERLLHPDMKIVDKLLPPSRPINLDLYYPNPRYFVPGFGILKDPAEA